MQRHIRTCVSSISSLAVKLPPIPSYISYILVAMLSTFIAFDWYLETSNLEADTTNHHLKELSCNLMLEGYLVYKEDSWGDMKDGVTSYWETLQCSVQMDIKQCTRLRKLYNEHSNHETSQSFQSLWKISHCDENRDLIIPSIDVKKPFVDRHVDKLSDSYSLGNISFAPSPSPSSSAPSSSPSLSPLSAPSQSNDITEDQDGNG